MDASILSSGPKRKNKSAPRSYLYDYTVSSSHLRENTLHSASAFRYNMHTEKLIYVLLFHIKSHAWRIYLSKSTCAVCCTPTAYKNAHLLRHQPHCNGANAMHTKLLFSFIYPVRLSHGLAQDEEYVKVIWMGVVGIYYTCAVDKQIWVCAMQWMSVLNNLISWWHSVVFRCAICFVIYVPHTLPFYYW